ncbi:MAG: hypothetical protein WCL02_02705 [bacterium]
MYSASKSGLPTSNTNFLFIATLSVNFPPFPPIHIVFISNFTGNSISPGKSLYASISISNFVGFDLSISIFPIFMYPVLSFMKISTAGSPALIVFSNFFPVASSKISISFSSLLIIFVILSLDISYHSGTSSSFVVSKKLSFKSIVMFFLVHLSTVSLGKFFGFVFSNHQRFVNLFSTIFIVSYIFW